MISIMFGGEAFSRSRRRAEAQRKDRQTAKPEGEGQRRRAHEHIVRRHAQHFLRIAIGDDQQVAVKMQRRLGCRWTRR
jgi:hypothetical protein